MDVLGFSGNYMKKEGCRAKDQHRKKITKYFSLHPSLKIMIS